jgi:hypothetical protein
MSKSTTTHEDIATFADNANNKPIQGMTKWQKFKYYSRKYWWVHVIVLLLTAMWVILVA